MWPSTTRPGFDSNSIADGGTGTAGGGTTGGTSLGLLFTGC